MSRELGVRRGLTKSLRAGFTLIEVIIIVGVVAVASRASLVILDGYVTHRSVDLTVREIEAVITDVRQRSIAQQSGMQWGIRFVNASTTHYYQIFSGPTFATGTVQSRVSLSDRVKFGQPSTSSTITVVFEPMTGGVASPVSITIVPKRGDAYLGIINISSLGRVGRESVEGMIGYWKFDSENASSSEDSTGLGGVAYGDNAASSTGEVPIQYASGTECKLGACVYLNDYFLQGILTTSQDFDEFTVSAWVKLTGNGNHGSVLTGLQGVQEWFDARFQASSRKPEFRTFDGEDMMAHNYSLTVGEWYHMAYVYDGAFKRTYANGVQIDYAAKTGLSFSLNEYDIGRSEEKDSYLLEGYIDELKLHNTALTPAEVLTEYDLLK